MSDIDFEALGRCKHISKQLESALRDRHTAYSRMDNCYKANGSGQVGTSVTTTDLNAMQTHFEEFKLIEQKIVELITEYNEWAPKAGERVIKFTKY